MTCIWYVLRNTVCTRVLRGGALSKYHTWNDITATPTRRTRLARCDNQCFDGCVPVPLYPYAYHEAPLIRFEWRDRVDSQTTNTSWGYNRPLYLENILAFLWPYCREVGRATYSLAAIIPLPCKKTREILAHPMLRIEKYTSVNSNVESFTWHMHGTHKYHTLDNRHIVQ